jgi:uroporphyrinogen-III decarboxylase
MIVLYEGRPFKNQLSGWVADIVTALLKHPVDDVSIRMDKTHPRHLSYSFEHRKSRIYASLARVKRTTILKIEQIDEQMQRVVVFDKTYALTEEDLYDAYKAEFKEMVKDLIRHLEIKTNHYYGITNKKQVFSTESDGVRAFGGRITEVDIDVDTGKASLLLENQVVVHTDFGSLNPTVGQYYLKENSVSRCLTQGEFMNDFVLV